jgi:hypothetical protein
MIYFRWGGDSRDPIERYFIKDVVLMALYTADIKL